MKISWAKQFSFDGRMGQQQKRCFYECVATKMQEIPKAGFRILYRF